MTYRLMSVLAVSGLLTVGCAGLKVKVEVYKGLIPSIEPLQLATAVKKIDCKTTCPPLTTKCVEELKAAYEAAATPDSAPGAAETMTNDMVKLFSEASAPCVKACADLKSDADDLDRHAFDVDAGEKAAGLSKKLAVLQTSWSSYGERLNELADFTRSFTGTPACAADPLKSVQSSPGPAEQVGKSRYIAASARKTDRIVGSPIFDPRVKLLTDDQDNWQEFGFNKFFASGGNAQFVVVREGLVVFHEKSLDFDPTPAIGAGIAITEVGLKVAAALSSGMTSIPLDTAKNAKAGSAEAGSKALEEVSNESKMTADRDLLARREGAKLQLLMSIAGLVDQIGEAKQAAGDKGLTVDQVTSYQKELDSLIAFYQGQVGVTEQETK